VKFKTAVTTTVGLEAAYQSGLRALRNTDRERLAARNPRQLSGSVNLDEALQHRFPQSPRWDYAVGLSLGQRQSDKVFWIEVHPATDGQIGSVLAKLQWLKRWLVAARSPLNAMEREFVWISSGKTALTAQSPQVKRMAMQGLRCVGQHFSIG